MNELKIFENPEFGTVRTVVIDGEPWFVGKDVCETFGDTHYRRSIANIDDDDKGVTQIDTAGGKQGMTVINESGLYTLLFQMQPQKANGVPQNAQRIEERVQKLKRFKHWVTHDVLPSIRKTGSYGIQKQDSYAIADPVERAKRWIEEQEEKKALESKISELAPKAKLCDDILDAKLLVNFRDAAKEIGISQSQFTGWLKENGYVYSTSSGELRPMEQYMESGLFKMQPYQNPYSGYKGSRTLITGRGLAAFKTLIDNSGHNRYTMKKHGGRKAV